MSFSLIFIKNRVNSTEMKNMKHRLVRYRLLVPVLFFLIVYLSQIFPYMHIHHEHDEDGSQLVLSYHIEETDFTNSHHHEHDHEHDDTDHQHSFNDFITWHFIRAQNINNINVPSPSALNSKSLKAFSFDVCSLFEVEPDNTFSLTIQSASIIRGPPTVTC